MKKLHPTEAAYVRDLHAALTPHNLKSFYNVIGKHAASMVELALHNDKDKKRDLMTSWLKIDRLNDKWIRLLCPVKDPNNPEYHAVCSKLIRGYSDLLGDFIVDGAVDKEQLDGVVDVSSKFYAALSDKRQTSSIRESWQRYTHSIAEMTRELEKGGKDHNFFTKARECIIAGNLLGSQLDYALFY